MITEFPQARIGETLGEVKRMITQTGRHFLTLNYIYVVDSQKRLKGVVSIKEILSTSENEGKVEDLMQRDLVVAHPLTRRDTLLYLALFRNLKAVPVVDKENLLLGIVPFDVMVTIFKEELHRGFFKFGGIYHKMGREFQTHRLPLKQIIKGRLPWVVMGVLGGIITASIISVFEHVLMTLLALVAFTPVLAYVSDAVGTQSETLAVRSMALEPTLSVKRYIRRELPVGFILASTCGLLIAVIASFLWKSPILGTIVWLSMFLNIVFATIITSLLPFLFKRFQLDPAFATGPFATLIGDIFTISSYFLVAFLLLTNM